MAGVIVVVLILMWGVLLVPMWLRRHDEAVELSSVDRFSSAMRSLSRDARDARSAAARPVLVPRPAREPRPGLRVMLATAIAHRRDRLAARPVAQTVAQPAVPSVPATAQRPAHPSRPAVGSSRALLLQRRRRVMSVLASATLGLALGWLAGVAPGALPLLTAALLAAYVVHLRREAVRASERRARTAARASQPATAARVVAPAVPVALAPAVAPTPAAVAPRAADAPPPVVAEPAVEEAAAWEPVATTLPTYVTAAVVRRPAVRLLDDDAGLSVFEAADDEVEHLVRRRAVNG